MAGSMRDRKRQKEEAEAKRKKTTYTIIGVVATVLVIALLTWDSGFFQSRATGATVDGKKYSVAELQYYYSGVYQTEVQNAYYGASEFDFNKAPEEQVKDEATGQTWHDYFLDQALEQIKISAALEKDAAANGYELPEEATNYKESLMENLKSTAISNGYSSVENYLKLTYGKFMTQDKFEEILDRELLASYYAQSKQEEYTYTDEQFNEYYKEHADELDTFVYDQFIFQASVPAETDAEGNEVAMTEEEQTAKLEKAKTEAKDLADEVKARLDAGESVSALIEEYQDKAYDCVQKETRVGSGVNGTLTEWMFDDDRQPGDTTIAEADGGMAYTYYVVKLESRSLNRADTANVRHILVSAGTEPNEEDYNVAKASAEDLLKQWKEGDATEDAFAKLATEKSADTGSASNGGLITNIDKSSGYVEEFENWALDPARKAGDTGLVQNTGSSTKGWHVMYFSGWDDPIWKLTAKNALLTDDIGNWTQSLIKDMEGTLGSGVKYVSAQP